MTDFVIRQGSTTPALRFTVTDLTEDFTYADATFSLRNVDTGVVKIDRAPAIIVSDTAPAVLGYEFVDGDTDTIGLYKGVFRVEYPNGKIGQFPDDPTILIEITAAFPTA